MPDVRPLHVGKFVPPPYAGVEAHVDTLLRALLPEVEGTLVAAESPQPPGPGEASPPYRLLTAKAYGKFSSATLSPGVLGLARGELASRRCNLLHIHAPNPWGDLAALRCPDDVPLVMTWHSDILRQRKLMKAYQFVQRRALARADRIVVFTPKHYESSAQLHQLDLGAKIALVPIGIDFDRLGQEFASPETSAMLGEFSRGRPTILTVGRHVYYKGYEYLLGAMARLRGDAVLIMVGTGTLTEALKKQADDLGIRERVLFLGEIGNAGLVSAFHHCDLFCLPSIARTEAFGIASAEAMACGKPTVVCELGNGVNYLNQAGRTGLTVPPRDPGALADALGTLVSDEGLRLRMGASARDWARGEFSVAAMKLGMMSLYESLQ
jgi:glycosyltransferase involved in cell wall biosynthesis